MRRARLIACAVPLLLATAGCLFPRASDAFRWARLPGGPTGADVVAFEYCLLEVPVGDRYANTEVWSAVDDQILPPDVRKRLDDNGFRVAKVTGRPPDALLDLLTSERSNRYSRKAESRFSTSRNVPPADSQLDPQLGRMGMYDGLRFRLVIDGKDEPVALEQARCSLQVTPVLGAEGKVTYRFVPQIQHTDRKKHGQFVPNIALALQGYKATESYPALKWEVTLGMNEYVLVGTRYDRPESLGFRLLVSSDGPRPVQRLMALRTFGAGPVADAAAPQPGGGPARAVAAPNVAPLAIP